MRGGDFWGESLCQKFFLFPSPPSSISNYGGQCPPYMTLLTADHWQLFKAASRPGAAGPQSLAVIPGSKGGRAWNVSLALS